MINAPTTSSTKRSRDIANFVRLRPATSSDDQVIGNLLVKAFTMTYEEKLPHIHTPPERIEELRNIDGRRKQGEVFVLELGFQIIGTATLIYPRAEETQSWIGNAANLRCVAIDPAFQGLGFSELLVDEAIRMARNWKSDFICLHVQSGAYGVARLYQRKGFLREPCGDGVFHGNLSEGYYLPLPAAEAALEPSA